MLQISIQKRGTPYGFTTFCSTHNPLAYQVDVAGMKITSLLYRAWFAG